MDDRRFDTLTRFLATPSRRSVITAAGSAALAALLNWDTEIAAKPKKKKKRKKKNKPCTQNCAGKVCGETNGCGGSCTACPQGQSCVNKQCVDDPCTPDCAGKGCGDGDGCGGVCTACPSGQTCQGQQCVDEPCTPDCTGKNCGDGNGCGGLCTTQQGCGVNQTCVGGSCITQTCDPPNLICQGRCVDPLTDRRHCSAIPGDCGFACPSSDDWECCNGQCAFIPGCTAGTGGWNACQTQHCGLCGQPCLEEFHGCCEGQCLNMVEGEDANANCGFCGAACPEFAPTCCGQCTDTESDEFNCGECGNACVSGEACCHGECTPLGTPENCTGCDAECEPDQVCVNSTVGCAGP